MHFGDVPPGADSIENQLWAIIAQHGPSLLPSDGIVVAEPHQQVFQPPTFAARFAREVGDQLRCRLVLVEQVPEFAIDRVLQETVGINPGLRLGGGNDDALIREGEDIQGIVCRASAEIDENVVSIEAQDVTDQFGFGRIGEIRHTDHLTAAADDSQILVRRRQQDALQAIDLACQERALFGGDTWSKNRCRSAPPRSPSTMITL